MSPTGARPARARRPSSRGVVAVVIAWAALVSCGVDVGDRTGQAGPRSTSSTTDAEPGSGGRPADEGEATPDTGSDDVPDEVFEGLGDPRIDVEHYDVHLRVDPDRSGVRGAITLRLAPTGTGPLRSFTLDLKGPEVTALSVDGRPAEVRAADEELTVVPAAPLEAGRSVDVEVTYAGLPDLDTFPQLGVPVGWQPDDAGGWFTMSEPAGTSSWAPVNDHPSDKATWRFRIETPPDATAVANGRLVSSDESDGVRTWVWDQDDPMATYLVLVAVGPYDLVERDGPHGTRVTFAFPRALPDRERTGFDELDAIVSRFVELFGPYPGDDTGAIVVPTELGLALETQSRPLFGEDALSGGTTWALAHELAHEWFGNAVTPEDWGDLWLNEGFATYADWLYRDTARPGALEQAVERSARIPQSYAVVAPEAAASFSVVLYERGARALHALRLLVGDEAFFATLRRWVAENRGGNGTTEGFVALAEEEAGRPLDAWVGTWLESAEQPAALPG